MQTCTILGGIKKQNICMYNLYINVINKNDHPTNRKRKNNKKVHMYRLLSQVAKSYLTQTDRNPDRQTTFVRGRKVKGKLRVRHMPTKK